MQFSKEIMKGVAETIVLQILKDLKEAYGYQLVKAIAQSSNNIFEFQEGTLYPLLYRLEDKGLVQSEKKAPANGKERRYYSLTSAGITSLKKRSSELKSLQQGLQHILPLSV